MSPNGATDSESVAPLGLMWVVIRTRGCAEPSPLAINGRTLGAQNQKPIPRRKLLQMLMLRHARANFRPLSYNLTLDDCRALGQPEGLFFRDCHAEAEDQ